MNNCNFQKLQETFKNITVERFFKRVDRFSLFDNHNDKAIICGKLFSCFPDCKSRNQLFRSCILFNEFVHNSESNQTIGKILATKDNQGNLIVNENRVIASLNRTKSNNDDIKCFEIEQIKSFLKIINKTTYIHEINLENVVNKMYIYCKNIKDEILEDFCKYCD